MFNFELILIKLAKYSGSKQSWSSDSDSEEIQTGTSTVFHTSLSSSLVMSLSICLSLEELSWLSSFIWNSACDDDVQKDLFLQVKFWFVDSCMLLSSRVLLLTSTVIMLISQSPSWSNPFTFIFLSTSFHLYFNNKKDSWTLKNYISLMPKISEIASTFWDCHWQEHLL
jgi:hypothetical protein